MIVLLGVGPLAGLAPRVKQSVYNVVVRLAFLAKILELLDRFLTQCRDMIRVESLEFTFQKTP